MLYLISIDNVAMDWNCWNLKYILSYGKCYFRFPFLLLYRIMVWCERKSCVILLPNIPLVNFWFRSRCTSYSKYEEQFSSYASLIISILFFYFWHWVIVLWTEKNFWFFMTWHDTYCNHTEFEYQKGSWYYFSIVKINYNWFTIH